VLMNNNWQLHYLLMCSKRLVHYKTRRRSEQAQLLASL
jgi:hypothetical protein